MIYLRRYKTRRALAIVSLILMAVFMIMPFAGVLTVHAEGEWDDSIYRVYDKDNFLSAAELEELDSKACAIVETYHIDFVMAVMDDADADGNMNAKMRDFYNENGYGYGPTKDGVILGIDPKNGVITISTLGNAVDVVPHDFIQSETDAYINVYVEGGDKGIYKVFLAGLEAFDEYFAKNLSGDDIVSGESSAGNNEGSADPSQPAWYPSNIANFEKYHSETASRVVDTADIFTDAEEAEMKQLIAEYSAELGKDIVIFTDNSSYGREHNIYAADFYDFNGYGIGPEYEGMCLMICMDPSNRGWYACATGPETRGLYTEVNANLLDDTLYEYMVNGNYGQGVISWISNIATLYQYGVPFVPSWYPTVEEQKNFVRTHDASAPRVIDSLNLFSETERADLERKCKDITEKYNIDVVIDAEAHTYGIADTDYVDALYKYCGYGIGDTDAGIVLKLDPSPFIVTYDHEKVRMTDVNASRMYDRMEPSRDKGDFYGVAVQFLSDLEHMEKTGRVQKTLGQWMGRGILAAIGGSIVGGVGLGGAAASMKSVKKATNAAGYVVGTPTVTRVSDTVYDFQVTRTKIEDDSNRSSGGGGGGSTYHSSYSGSSGTSHSGSGRKF